MTDRNLMTVTEAAASLGVCARTVERMLQDGRLPSLRIGAARMVQAGQVAALRRRRYERRASARRAS